MASALCAPITTLPASAQTARDSAGIRIVENAQPAWSASDALTLSAAPSLVIGNRVGEAYEFSRVAGTARLSDGRIVIADGGSLQLRFYDASGSFLNSGAWTRCSDCRVIRWP